VKRRVAFAECHLCNTHRAPANARNRIVEALCDDGLISFGFSRVFGSITSPARRYRDRPVISLPTHHKTWCNAQVFLLLSVVYPSKLKATQRGHDDSYACSGEEVLKFNVCSGVALSLMHA
jgi:hypothetical protein